MKLSFSVIGLPAPQGSKRHVGNGIMIESSKNVKPWREAVKWAAIEAVSGKPVIQGPVSLDIEFLLPRPKAAKKRVYPANRPDLDKLIRSTCDALTQVGVYRDDSQVVVLNASKRYADSERCVGAFITVMEIL